MRTGIDCIGVSTSFYCHDGKGNILLHKRSKNCRDEVGVWDCGGGKLEYGLTPEENVLKEIKEEYGCLGIIQKQLPVISLHRHNKDKIPTHWIIIPFVVLLKRNEVKNNDPEKIDEIQWFSFHTLPSPLHSGFIKTFNTNKEVFFSL